MKVLITGITGFAGSHLADMILNENLGEVHGTVRWRSDRTNIKHIADKIHLHDCELRDASNVVDMINEVKPDRIFHLAAQSFVPTSWASPSDSLSANVIGQLNIFEAVRKAGINPWIQIACSSEEYGMVYEDETPIKETNPLRPLSPYAVSKVGQDMLGYQYAQSYDMKIVRSRCFNHTGPRRGPVFVCSDFAKQIVDMEKGKREPVINHGNLDARRDFTDVRDVVRAYWMSLGGSCNAGEEYNICSGKTWYIKDVVKMLADMSSVNVKLKADPKRMRPSDVEILLGDNSKFVKATGWEPEITFEQTLEDLMNYWRNFPE